MTRMCPDIAAIIDSTNNFNQLLMIMNKTFKDFGLNIDLNVIKI